MSTLATLPLTESASGRKCYIVECLDPHQLVRTLLFVQLVLGMGLLACGWAAYFSGLVAGALAVFTSVLGIPHTYTVRAYSKCRFLFEPMATFRHLSHLLVVLMLTAAAAACITAFSIGYNRRSRQSRQLEVLEYIALGCAILLTAASLILWLALPRAVNSAFLSAAFSSVTLFPLARPERASNRSSVACDRVASLEHRVSQREESSVAPATAGSMVPTNALIELPRVAHPPPKNKRSALLAAPEPNAAVTPRGVRGSSWVAPPDAQSPTSSGVPPLAGSCSASSDSAGGAADRDDSNEFMLSLQMQVQSALNANRI